MHFKLLRRQERCVCVCLSSYNIVCSVVQKVLLACCVVGQPSLSVNEVIGQIMSFMSFHVIKRHFIS
jgi:hypothetical protein